MHFRKNLISSFLIILPVAIIMSLFELGTTDDNFPAILIYGLKLLAAGTLFGMLQHSLLFYLQNKKKKSPPQHT